MSDIHPRLATNLALRRHVEDAATDDPLFFLTHRHFLVRGLTARQRADAALAHYEHEVAAFDQGYFEAVYERGGLALWSETVDGTAYDVRLMMGNDVLYEGGLSLVLHVDGNRVCVMSFSIVPTAIVLPDGGGLAPMSATIPFVVRKQLAADRDYQVAFNRAFDRATPAHLCFGALTGWALALGFTHAVGIAPERHPSFAEDRRRHFDIAYREFWESLSGRRASPFGYLLDLPMRLTPPEALGASRRKRAAARRAHIEAVQRSAHDRIRAHLRKAGGAPSLVAAGDGR